MNRILSFGFLCFVAVMLASATWFSVFLPARVLKQAQNEFLIRTGRMLDVAHGASLRMSPSFGIALNDISVSGVSAMAAPVVQAKALFIPVSLFEVLGLKVANGDMVVEAPTFTININSEGRSNIVLDGTAPVSKSDANAQLPPPMHVTFQNGTFVYQDELNTKTFALYEAEGLIIVDDEQEITLKSAATLGGQRVHFQAILNSLPRAFDDGSPFDFNLQGAASSFGFSGRLVATKGIELAGQATVDSDDAAQLFKWLGVGLHGLNGKHRLAITSAIETRGPLFLFKKADIKFANMKAQGDISFSAAGARPSLTLALGLDELNTNLYSVPVKSLTPLGSWSDRPFDLNDMSALNVQFRIAANQVRFGGFTTGTAEVVGELKEGVLKTSITSEISGKADIDLDAAQSPAKLSLNLDLKNIEAKTFMPQFAGMSWLQAPMGLNASLNTKGATQAEMISNLIGNIRMQGDQAQIKGANLAGLAAHVESEAVTGWEGEATNSVSVNATLSVEDGVATLQESVLTLPDLKISQTGEIDILRQALNMEATLNRSGGKPVKIKIVGPWAKPNLAIVKSGN